MENDVLKAKIQKLFALSESSNANEAAVAIQKAKELLYKNGLSKDDILNIHVGDIKEFFVFEGLRIPIWKQFLLDSVAEYFDCSDIYRKQKPINKKDSMSKYFIVGLESNAISALVCYNYLIEKIPPKANKDFKTGFASTICDRVEAFKQAEKSEPQYQSYGLIVTNSVNSYLISINTKLDHSIELKCKYNTPEFRNGQSEAEKVSLSRQVADSKQKYLV